MLLLLGIALLVGGIGAILAARPRHGVPRFFVNTRLETPIAVSLVMAIGVGALLTVAGIAELTQ
jgi:hypothetical protein